MQNANDAVFEYLIGQLRQQVASSQYKQQCEDLAREVLSLKNQLRDASALVDELQKGASIPSKASPSVNSAAWKLHDALVAKGPINGAQFNILKVAFYDAMLAALGKSEADTEQSGCCKEDTQECEHDWVLDEKGDYFVCAKCLKQEAELIDCQHTNTVGLRKGFAPGFTKKCLDCGAKLK